MSNPALADELNCGESRTAAVARAGRVGSNRGVNLPDLPGSRRRRVVLLGSTGSIGESACRVVRALPERLELVGLAAGARVERLAEQAQEFGVREVVTGCEGKLPELRSQVVPSTQCSAGAAALCELAALPEADIVLIAIVGTAGLAPALAAIEAGKDLAVASKEILVMAGGIVMEAARRRGVRVLPVDSEHNAIFQCLQGVGADQVSRLILTASGGPFRTWAKEKLAEVSLEQALKHPTWDMGAKITIDSATLFNKGLEMIEARWLFEVPMERVAVVIHPQSIVHSLVETVDGSVLAQLSRTDMGFPIQYALTFPERVAGALAPLDFGQLGKLEFEEPRCADFPALDLARWAGTEGGTLPAVLNAANEVAVDAFRARQLSFPGIWRTVETVMCRHEPGPGTTLDELTQADAWARAVASEAVGKAGCLV